MREQDGLKFLEYGNQAGKTVIYFHGAPGAPEECSFFDQFARTHDLNIICYDRFSIDSKRQNQAYFHYLSKLIIERSGGRKIDLIGFSIGCHAAIETVHHLQNQVRELHLISPAAPLDAAYFLNGMAGKMIFSLAMNRSFLFTLLSYWQAFLAKIAPSLLFKMLFATAEGEDKTLAQTADFKASMKPVLTRCFATNIKGYLREIRQYVSPWRTSVLNCNARTHIWHGENDNWSPVSMAEYLKENMPLASSLELMEGLSHYSCLYSAAPRICAQLEKQ